MAHRRVGVDRLDWVRRSARSGPDRDRRVLRKFKERYGIEYPLLVAGISDKAEAARSVPDISAVLLS
jgi:hypothetical protein